MSLRAKWRGLPLEAGGISWALPVGDAVRVLSEALGVLQGGKPVLLVSIEAKWADRPSVSSSPFMAQSLFPNGLLDVMKTVDCGCVVSSTRFPFRQSDDSFANELPSRHVTKADPGTTIQAGRIRSGTEHENHDGNIKETLHQRRTCAGGTQFPTDDAVRNLEIYCTLFRRF